MDDSPAPLSLATADGVELAGERSGEGPAIVLLHGLTATRRYVVMGSRLLQRSGHEVIAYDARGHGASAPSPERLYGYEHLARDVLAVLEAAGVEGAVLAGSSMGAHTAVAVALAHPERVRGLVLITPAHLPGSERSEDSLARWDALAAGLREGGVDGFIAAYDLEAVPDRWRETVATALRQRLSAHEHPLAVADALEVVPRSEPFASLAELATLRAPTLIVASRDEADPGHALAVAEEYARAIPGALLRVEEPGTPPLAWQGGRLSREIAAFASSSLRA